MKEELASLYPQPYVRSGKCTRHPFSYCHLPCHDNYPLTAVITSGSNYRHLLGRKVVVVIEVMVS